MGVGDPQLPARIPTRGTQVLPHALGAYAYGAITLYGAAFQRTSASPLGRLTGGTCNTTSTLPFGRVFGLGSAGFGRPYSRHRVCFLFLRVLGCFLSPRSRSLPGASPKGQDIPFGDPGFHGSLRLPRAFRSLARPSSAPEPSHPPAGITAGLAGPSQYLRIDPCTVSPAPKTGASTLPRRLSSPGASFTLGGLNFIIKFK